MPYDDKPMPDAGMDTPPEAMADPSTPKPAAPTGGNEFPVPLSALAMPGEDEKMNAPGLGDPVQLQAEGTVTRIEGETAFVSVKTVNGQPLTAEAAKTANTPNADENGDNEFAQLQSEAANMPQRM